MTPEPTSYPRHQFPAEIISQGVWLYHVFSLSLRDVELILAERGIVVTHESIRHWCFKFGADFARMLHRRRPQPVDTWHLDEVFIRIPGVLHYFRCAALFMARSGPARGRARSAQCPCGSAWPVCHSTGAGKSHAPILERGPIRLCATL